MADSPNVTAGLVGVGLNTEGLALLVAAVGAALATGDVSIRDYAGWLASQTVDDLPSNPDPRYPQKSRAILNDMLDRLHPAERRCLDYAAWLPQDAIRPEGVDRGKDVIGRSKSPGDVVHRLRALNLLLAGLRDLPLASSSAGKKDSRAARHPAGDRRGRL